MRMNCIHCGRSLEFLGPAPKFCGYCGKALSTDALDQTASYQPNSTSTEDAFSPAVDEEVPARIGEYDVIRTLGGGGMGVVYEAQNASGRRVAVKLMRAEAGRSSAAEERFRQEGRLASGIAHPRCVFVLGADQSGDRPYIVMELMSGETLKDLVEKNGPLEPLDAVAKILDVVDGLIEAHALGVIHRDVKPSNCFLEADGRVKIGDFGLSRSLAAPSHLTQTGGFLGTVLFASPEQHKAENVDARTDVYSVCATLYYMLAGKAPFEGVSGTAAIAKILTEPAPPLRQSRPSIPRRLDAIVQRGLERSPDRRFQSLEELRAELASLLPSQLTLAGIASRAAAYIFDAYLVQVAVAILLLPMAFKLAPQAAMFIVEGEPFLRIAEVVLYFWILESIWGASLGKRLLRLRVTSVDGVHAPNWMTMFLRTAVFCVLLEGIADLGLEKKIPGVSELYSGVLYFAVLGACLLLLMSTMRSCNGFRMLHDVLSGTRVVQLPWPKSASNLKCRPLEGRPIEPLPPDVPRRLGRFDLRAFIHERGEGRLFLGWDAELDRTAVLWLRRGSPISEARRRSIRTSRFRWLDGGAEGDQVWDAFLTPRGGTLPEVVADNGELQWSTVRTMLEQLADELHAAEQEGTSVPAMKPNDVWLESTGRLQLAEWPLDASHSAGRASADAAGLSLMRRCAVLALEGKPRSPDEEARPIQSVLPLHARSIVNRLLGAQEAFLDRMFGGKKPYETLAQLQEDLAATKNLPVRVNGALRALQVSLMSLGLALVVMVLLVASRAASYQEAARLDQNVRQTVWRRTFSHPGLRNLWLDKLPADHPFRMNPALLDDLVERKAEEDRDRLADLKLHRPPLGRALMLVRIQLDAGDDDQRSSFVDQVFQAPTADDPRLAVGLKSPGGVQTYAFEIRRDDVVPIDWADESYGGGELDYTQIARWMAGGVLLLWIAWGVAFGGGLSYRLAGIALVRSTGRNARRSQVLLRALIFWTPLLATVLAAAWVDAFHPDWILTCEALNWATLLILAGYGFAVFRSPERHWHDRMAGVHLVPR